MSRNDWRTHDVLTAAALGCLIGWVAGIVYLVVGLNLAGVLSVS